MFWKSKSRDYEGPNTFKGVTVEEKYVYARHYKQEYYFFRIPRNEIKTVVIGEGNSGYVELMFIGINGNTLASWGRQLGAADKTNNDLVELQDWLLRVL